MRQKRRRLLIDRLQYRLLAVNVLYFGVVAVVFAFLLFGPLIQQLLVNDLDPVSRDQASSAFLTLHQRVWPPLIIAFICLTIHSLVVSHRIAGPLYQFRRIFGQLRDGDLTARATLRRGDYLTAEAQIINDMSESLEQRLLETQKNGLDLCAGLDSVKRELNTARSSPDIVKLVEILDARSDRFRDSIVAFKTAPVPFAEPAETSESEEPPDLSWEATRELGHGVITQGTETG